jgi:mRNA-degrading endonuclease YafQ of YafQ-DinJ toxin-antitoxin module
MLKLRLTASFEREFVKITKGNTPLKKKVIKTLDIVSQNPRHPSLRLHKLKGESYWSISVDMSVRILILFKNDAIYVYHIGKHEDVY